MLKTSFNKGALAALHHFKLASSMGASIPIQPPGPEVSHGTELLPYPAQQTDASAAQDSMPDWLWDNFTTYDKGMAPGSADGSYGQETIG